MRQPVDERHGSDSEFAPLAGEYAVATINIREWLRTLRRHKGMIAAIVVIGLVAALVVLDDTVPRYTATAKVMIQSANGAGVVDFEAVMAGVGSDAAAVASQIEILTSQSLIGRLVDELDLTQDPEFNPYIDTGETSWLAATMAGVKGLLPDWLLRSLGLKGPPAGALDETEQAALERAAVINSVLDHLDIETIRPTFVIRIAATSEDPRKAALIANTQARLYIVDQLEAKFEATQQANDWLSGRLEELRQATLEAEGLVSAYRVENNLGEGNDQSLVEQQLNDANSQLTLARSELAAAQANYSQVQSLLDNQGVDSVAQVLDSPLIQQLRQQEAQAKRDLAELSTRYGERHPDIINAKAEITDIQETISTEVAKIVQNLANQVAVARARTNSIEQTVNQLSQGFNTERTATVRLRELEREADATRQLYDTMLARYKEVSEQEKIQEPDARLISEAAVPLAPSWPNKKLILALAGMVSLVIGIVLAFLIEQMRSGFRSLSAIEAALGIPGLVEIPLLRRGNKGPQEQILKHQTSAFSEAVRSVHTALALSNVDNPPKVICVVSSVPEEGKSALVSSLGLSTASGGRRVLVIDCDFRRPQQHRLVGTPRSPGLSEYLAGEATLEQVISVHEQTGLAVISAGRDVPNPANLLQSQKMSDAIARLRAEYDMVLLDTPAIMALSDGLVVANIAEATLMLVRWEKTPREVATTAMRHLRSAGAKLVGVVLSQVDQKKQSTYGYSAQGYYYGRYKSYYSK